MHEFTLWENPLCHASTRLLFVFVADIANPAARAARENSEVLRKQIKPWRYFAPASFVIQNVSVPIQSPRERDVPMAEEGGCVGGFGHGFVPTVTDATSLASQQATFTWLPPKIPLSTARVYGVTSPLYAEKNRSLVEHLTIASDVWSGVVGTPQSEPRWHYVSQTLSLEKYFSGHLIRQQAALYTLKPGLTYLMGATVTGEEGFSDPHESPAGESPASKTSFEDDDSLRNDFAWAFRIDPESAVDALAEVVKIRPNGGRVAARVFLPYLVRASYAQQNLFLDAILRASTPSDVLHAAIDLATRDGGEAILDIAADVLEHFGEEAWPALSKLAFTKDPICRHFVRAIAHTPSGSEEEKIEALVALAKNPDLDTRWLASSVADEVSHEATVAVWQTLCNDPDEQLRAAAEAQVDSLSK